MIKDTHLMGSKPPQPSRASALPDHPDQPPLDITPEQLIGRLGITAEFDRGQWQHLNELTIELTFDGITICKASCYVDPSGYVQEGSAQW